MPKALPTAAVKVIENAVERTFARAKARFSGSIPPGTPKHLVLTLNPSMSVVNLFKLAAKAEGVKPNEDLIHPIVKIGLSYLDATKEKAKAKTIHAVQAFLHDAQSKGVDTDLETVLQGELSGLWGQIFNDVKRIVNTEVNSAKNMSILDALTKINSSSGINDPTIYWVCVHDNALCQECKRLHLMPDLKTPRVWRLSEVGSGYHKIGDLNPKMSLHPSDRCQIATVLLGYGFNPAGEIEYKSPGYDVLKVQRGI